VQEVTRCAARQAAVNWSDQWPAIQQQCLFNQNEMVAGWEVGATDIQLRHLNNCGDDDVANPGSAADNFVECANETEDCIRFVEASVQRCDHEGKHCQPVSYQPVFGLIRLNVGIPESTVCMPAESLGN